VDAEEPVDARAFATSRPDVDPPVTSQAFSLDVGREVLRRTPVVLQSLLSGLSEQWVNRSEEPDAWSPFQVVCHLTYIEETDWIDRTRVILEHGSDHVFVPVDRVAGLQRYEAWELRAVLGRFSAVRSENLASLDELVVPRDLERRGTHPDFGSVTLSQLLATWVVHDLNHLSQIVKTMAKQYTTAVGPWRAFLPIIDSP
jgi:hypothetical protein